MTRQNLIRTAATLLLAAIGGALFFFVGTPLPWLLGAMAATAPAALAGAPVHLPVKLRTALVAVLGILLGSGFAPGMGGPTSWLVSLVTIGLFALVLTAIGYVMLRRLVGLDPVTAYFGAAPGGLSEMILLSGQHGGDERIVALIHVLRVMIVVTALAFWFTAVAGYDRPGAQLPGPRLFDIPPAELALLTACLVGWPLARLARLPTPSLSGPLIVSAVLHATGTVSAAPPAEIVIIAQIVLGGSVGARFAGAALGEVVRVSGVALLLTVMMLLVTGVVVAAMHFLAGFGIAALILAYAPGGLAETGLIALAIGVDPGFVAVHHFTRIGVILAVIPLVFSRLSVKK